MRLDDLAIPVMLIIVGAVRVVPQLIVGGRWGGQSTVAAVLLGLGVILLLAEVLRHGPKATVP
jgi:hypothetical protein